MSSSIDFAYWPKHLKMVECGPLEINLIVEQFYAYDGRIIRPQQILDIGNI